MKVSLVGLMGAGKSTLGRLLAAELSARVPSGPAQTCRFVDLDTEIEQRAGQTIISIFETSGEAHFRQIESDTLLSLLDSNDSLVLATGGGTPCQPGLMDLLLDRGPVLWLDAPIELLAERAQADHQRGHVRPLLYPGAHTDFDSAFATSRLRSLLEARRPYYARGHRLDASRPLAAQIAAAMSILTPRSPMPKPPLEVVLPASLPHRYPIHLTPELPGPLLAELVVALDPPPHRALVVTDDHVAPLYLAGVLEALTSAGLTTHEVILPHGESQKSANTALDLVTAALVSRLSRTDLFVALGGGVIGDLTGFAAAITQRGLRVVQVPTTLLSQVDSSVGGKTGVNHPRGKNLIGAFWQPVGVVASQQVLNTLPEREVRCGLAEAIKHAFIADASLLAFILEHADALRALCPEPTAHLVAACCRIKAEVVADDEREDPVSGRRAILNFGHTFGHAFEAHYGYGALTHGEAVALGMVMAARLSDRLGVSHGLEPRVIQALQLLDLPHDPFSPDRPGLASLIDLARGDKKGQGDHVRFVLLADIGQPVVSRLSWVEIATQLGGPA